MTATSKLLTYSRKRK